MAVAARREVVRELKEQGLSERQALRLVGMSASTLRYEPRDDGNDKLRERLKELSPPVEYSPLSPVEYSPV